MCNRGVGIARTDSDARGAKPGNDQVAPLKECVAGKRRQCRRAGVPAEMVELVALYGIVTVWTIRLNVGEPGFTSITAGASGSEKSGLSSKV
jgi:hypothetical protein